MSEEFRIQHIAQLMNKTLKTTYKADHIAKDFLDNKTAFITPQVNVHNTVREIAEKTKTPREFLAIHEDLKARNVRILSGWTYIIQKILKSPKIKAFTSAHSDYIGKNAEVERMPPIQTKRTIQEEMVDDKENIVSLDGNVDVDEFANLLNNSIESGKRKIKSGKRPRTSSCSDLENLTKKIAFETSYPGAGDSKHLTLSKETILDVNVQEQTAKYNKQSSGPTLRQPDWWNQDFELAPTRYIPGKLEALPESVQENLIVQDLLSLLIGGKAAHFKTEIEEAGKTGNFLLNFANYIIDPKCDSSLKCLTVDPLRLVNCLDVIRSFVVSRSDFHFGYLSHALAAELDCYLQEVYGQIQDFEESVTSKTDLVDSLKPLQQMSNFVRPIYNQTVLVKDLCIELIKSNARGATILSILHEKAVNSAGHFAGQHILYFLTRETAKPYLKMITLWIQKGVLKDDHNEFMINAREELGKEKLQNVYNDSYWEQHYSIVRERIPRFLEPFAEKILNTGKYLNVIRECAISVQTPSGIKQLEYNMGPNCVRLFEAPIDHCYKFAAKVLVDLLMKEHDLINRLKSMKRFFLLDQGDFLIQFIDLADDELKMPVSDITSSRLEALLDISIRTSAADKDPYKDDLKVVLSDKDLITELMSVILIESKEEETLRRVNPHDVGLSGMEALSFDYVVKWPISLVISRKKIVHYQLLFRFLFYTKHIERIINNIWSSAAQLSKQYGCHTLYYKAAILRHKMLNFVLNLQTYVTNEVIEPHWHVLMKKLKNVENIDEVLAAHDQFLETCLRECHLSNKFIFKIIQKLMMLITQYVNYIQSIHRQIEIKSASSMTTKEKMEYLARIFSESFDIQIRQMDSNFNKSMIHLVNSLREVSRKQKSDSVLNLVLKLDFNHFITNIENRMES